MTKKMTDYEKEVKARMAQQDKAKRGNYDKPRVSDFNNGTTKQAKMSDRIEMRKK